MREYDPLALAKGILWEEAKGKLRAIVAAEGSRISDGFLGERELPFEVISKRVEKFIKNFESDGFHE